MSGRGVLVIEVLYLAWNSKTLASWREYHQQVLIPSVDPYIHWRHPGGGRNLLSCVESYCVTWNKNYSPFSVFVAISNSLGYESKPWSPMPLSLSLRGWDWRQWCCNGRSEECTWAACSLICAKEAHLKDAEAYHYMCCPVLYPQITGGERLPEEFFILICRKGCAI